MNASPKPKTVKRTRADVVPTCQWYLAEDVRSELNGKLSLMGVYPTNTIVVEMPPEVPDPTPEEPIGLEGLTVVCVLTGFIGKEEFELVLTDKPPTSLALTRTVLVESESAVASANLVSRFRPAAIRSFGDKEFSISCAAIGFKNTFTFNIQRRDINLPPEPAPRISLAPLKVAPSNPRAAQARTTAKRKRVQK